jgi:hypothetical protein
LELAYRNGSQCNRNVTDTFELRLPNLALWLKAELLKRARGGASRRNFRQIKGLIPPR